MKFLFLNLFLLDAKSHPRVLLTHIPLYRRDQTPCGPHRASSVIDQVIYLCLESCVVQTQKSKHFVLWSNVFSLMLTADLAPFSRSRSNVNFCLFSSILKYTEVVVKTS